MCLCLLEHGPQRLADLRAIGPRLGQGDNLKDEGEFRLHGSKALIRHYSAPRWLSGADRLVRRKGSPMG